MTPEDFQYSDESDYIPECERPRKTRKQSGKKGTSKSSGVGSDMNQSVHLEFFGVEGKNLRSQGVYDVNNNCVCRRSICTSEKPLVCERLPNLRSEGPKVFGICCKTPTRTTEVAGSTFVICNKIKNKWYACGVFTWDCATKSIVNPSDDPADVDKYLNEMRESTPSAEKEVVKGMFLKRGRQEPGETSAWEEYGQPAAKNSCAKNAEEDGCCYAPPTTELSSALPPLFPNQPFYIFYNGNFVHAGYLCPLPSFISPNANPVDAQVHEDPTMSCSYDSANSDAKASVQATSEEPSFEDSSDKTVNTDSLPIPHDSYEQTYAEGAYMNSSPFCPPTTF